MVIKNNLIKQLNALFCKCLPSNFHAPVRSHFHAVARNFNGIDRSKFAEFGRAFAGWQVILVLRNELFEWHAHSVGDIAVAKLLRCSGIRVDGPVLFTRYPCLLGV